MEFIGKYSPFCKKQLQRLIVPYIFVALFWVMHFACLFLNRNGPVRFYHNKKSQELPATKNGV